MIKHRVKKNKSVIEFGSESEALAYASAQLGEYLGAIEDFELDVYDYESAQRDAVKFGKFLADEMTIAMGAKAKKLRIEQGLILGGSLVDINSKLERYLLKGALYPDAMNEIAEIVDSGQVDQFLDIYSSAALQIEDFING